MLGKSCETFVIVHDIGMYCLECTVSEFLDWVEVVRRAVQDDRESCILLFIIYCKIFRETGGLNSGFAC